MYSPLRVAPRPVGAEFPGTDLVEDCFRHDRPGRIARAEKQDVERTRAHNTSNRWERLKTNAPHHGFKIVAYLLGKAQALNDSGGTKQRQGANIIKGKLAIDRCRAFDQMI